MALTLQNKVCMFLNGFCNLYSLAILCKRLKQIKKKPTSGLLYDHEFQWSIELPVWNGVHERD